MKTNTKCPVCQNETYTTENWLEMLEATSNNKKIILVVCDSCGNVYAREKL